jgi:hypothetical protein
MAHTAIATLNCHYTVTFLTLHTLSPYSNCSCAFLCRNSQRECVTKGMDAKQWKKGTTAHICHFQRCCRHQWSGKPKFPFMFLTWTHLPESNVRKSPCARTAHWQLVNTSHKWKFNDQFGRFGQLFRESGVTVNICLRVRLTENGQQLLPTFSDKDRHKLR